MRATDNYRMPTCNGHGDCIRQCVCICIEDDEHETPSLVCTCGHRDHTKISGGRYNYSAIGDDQEYCKAVCPHNCQLVKCNNYKLCSQKRPQFLLWCHNGMCTDCAVMVGKLKFLDEKTDCPVCLNDNKEMIETKCKHTFCLECWKQWAEASTKTPLDCPICRDPIWTPRKDSTN